MPDWFQKASSASRMPNRSNFEMYPTSGPGRPTSLGAAYSSMEMGLLLMPSSSRMPFTVATSPAIFDDLISSCHAMMSGTVLVALAFCRNFRMSLMLSEKLGPWIGLLGSIERTCRNVLVQNSS
ncbi:hypothetical protein ASD16_08780 [Cellulomonas sp. Root485]|nr:hypothetical protein ASD16_08780 [Cellulomonas sp. Root485]